MTTTKLNFTQQVSRHSINPIELTLYPTKWACVRILLKPMRLTIATKGLFTCLTLNRILQDVVANSTYELR